MSEQRSIEPSRAVADGNLPPAPAAQAVDPTGAPRYWAFLSYSHRDQVWADWLHRRLEGFAVPRRFVGQATTVGPAPTRFRPIFRDRDELEVAANLNERLQVALRSSAYLIVICSPAAAASRWVDAEIRHFKALNGDGRVLAVIVDGEPFASETPGGAANECLPLALRRKVETDGTLGETRIEVIAADLRPRQGGRRLALLKLVSGMLGVGLDQLIQRDAQRRQVQLLALATAALAGAVILGGLSLVALRERDTARSERAQAEGLVEFMVGDLRNRLEPAGRLDVLDSVAARALAYYTAQENRGLDATSLGRRARVLHLLGEIRDRRGDTRAAQTFFEEAARSTAELLARNPNDPHLIFDNAQSVFWVGYLASRRGHDELAREKFLEYQRLAERLVAIDPRNPAWQAEVGYASGGLGTVLFDEGQTDAAAAAFARQLAILQQLARAEPASHTRQTDLCQGYAWMADADMTRGRYAEALASRAAEEAIYHDLQQRTPGDSAAIVGLIVNRTAVARIHLLQRRLNQATGELRSAVADLDRLIASAPEDTDYRSKSAAALQLLGQALMLSGDPAAAAPVADRARDLMEALVLRDPTVAEWSGQKLASARLLVIRIAATRARTEAARLDALRPSLAEAARLSALSAARPRYLVLSRMASEAQILAGDYDDLAGDRRGARTYWMAAATRLRRLHLAPADRAQIILRQASDRLGGRGVAAGRDPTAGQPARNGSRHLASSPVDYAW